MSNAISGVLSYLETAVKSVVTDLKPSPNVYDPNKNGNNINCVFAIRQGAAANSQAGVVGSLTVSQSFEVELIRDFKGQEDSDTQLRKSIDQLNTDHESLMKRVSLRNSSIVQILSIPDVSLSTPNINHSKKLVSITATYTIIYRRKLVGA